LIPPTENLDNIPHLPKARKVKAKFNSIWTRDYGPVGGMVQDDDNGKNMSRAVVDAVYRQADTRVEDDQIPCQMAKSFPTKLACRSSSIIMDGGNLLFDGHGGLFTTTVTYEWNNHLTKRQVDQELKATFGIKTIYSMEYAKVAGTKHPADGTGHIDMFVKILAPCIVIVAQAPPSNTAYFTVLNQAATFFSNLQCETKDADSSPSVYQVHRVAGWEDKQGTWYTYTNSLIVNDRVLVPSYSYSTKKNIQALAVYNTAAPHLTVDFVNSDDIIHYGGAVHCMTREIPRRTKRSW
jgi:agmatine/peptidylarginine deiminase